MLKSSVKLTYLSLSSYLDAEESVEKSVMSQRFVDLMNATSRHENLVEIAEDIERQDYFNKMEKKEQLEEKMLTTYKVPCKAVVCLKVSASYFPLSPIPELISIRAY